jgi:predicted Rossmann-fold nucleotide-binding protein
LDEAFEILTAKQIDLHKRPINRLDNGMFWHDRQQFSQYASFMGVLRSNVMAMFRCYVEVAKITVLAGIASSKQASAHSKLVFHRDINVGTGDVSLYR